ncbi:TonB-dependent receptor [Pasteurella skyensis]|uniref:TonB-dependent receptor n=1 Tax=Phocoenobacter skyensis TaxID=97481 RepID=A0AAJ6NDT0_9PAST|nr:TonB-dependent receptor [Pasteurella skyensis]MDP8170787.1 TonB-dependent receptor [Pasteurella skyensis]MDP8174895.1 TonB-dependent receptor [Pasteurella skyensis]
MKFSNIYICIMIGLSPIASIAQNSSAEGNDNHPKITAQNSTELAPILVYGGSFAQQMGTQKLNSLEISRLPTKNGTVSDLLKSNPNVRFQNFADVSETQGEISPENVSFHGERFYNNAWLIDGMSNNDNIHPGSGNGRLLANPDGRSPAVLPAGGTQSFWINSDIIDSVTVYDSNISAKYGQFTGGVIDAKLKDPSFDAKISGSISYRTTRDAWTKFHTYGNTAEEKEKNEENFKKADELYYQPKFTKHNYAVNVNIPVNDRTAVMFSYNKASSRIPFFNRRSQDWNEQKRDSETFLLKGSHELTNRDMLKLSLMHSPHSSKYFANSRADSGYTNIGGGNRIALDWKHLFDSSTLSTKITWKKSGNKIKHDRSEYYSWGKAKYVWVRDPVTNKRKRVLEMYKNSPCPKSYNYISLNCDIGGFGEYDTYRRSLVLKQDLQIDTFKFGNTEHNFSMGWKADLAKAGFNRKTELYTYTASKIKKPTDPKYSCKEGDSTCIEGEQFIKIKNFYPIKNTVVNNNHYSVYFEDNIKYKQFEITPGIRIDYDQYLGNTDIAPRLTASYNVFNDKNTRIFGGVNRYYADSMLSSALRDDLQKSIKYYYRSKPQDDFMLKVPNRVNPNWTRSGVDKLKTPYSDEFNLGMSQRFGNTEWTAKWVHRKAKDQFSSRYAGKQKVEYIDPKTKKIRTYKENWYNLTNEGSSTSDSYTLTGRLMKPFETKYTTISWNLGASYSKTKSNFDIDHSSARQADYDDVITKEQQIDKVVFDGKLINKGDMPSLDFNRPWTLFANINFDFPSIRLNWSNRLNYTAPYQMYVTDNCENNNYASVCGKYAGEDIDVYEKQNFKKRFSLDWHFAYTQPIGKTNLELNLDVLNVLNSTIESASPSNATKVSYKAGRQFWLGAKYSW